MRRKPARPGLPISPSRGSRQGRRPPCSPPACLHFGPSCGRQSRRRIPPWGWARPGARGRTQRGSTSRAGRKPGPVGPLQACPPGPAPAAAQSPSAPGRPGPGVSLGRGAGPVTAEPALRAHGPALPDPRSGSGPDPAPAPALSGPARPRQGAPRRRRARRREGQRGVSGGRGGQSSQSDDTEAWPRGLKWAVLRGRVAEGGREGGAPAEGRELPLSGGRPGQRAWRRSRELAA